MGCISEDVLHLILSWLDVPGLCSVRQVCKRTHAAGAHDELWLALAQTSGLAAAEHIGDAMCAFGLSTCHQLMETLHKVQMPAGVIGLWRAEAPPSESFGGELLSVTAIPGGLLCRILNGDGTKRELFRVRVKARAAPAEGVNVVFFNLEHELSPSALPVARGAAGAAKVGLRRSGDGFQLIRSGVVRHFSRLSLSNSSSSSSSSVARERYPLCLHDMAPMAGMWSAYYGSHSPEVVQASVELQPAGTAAATATATPTPAATAAAAADDDADPLAQQHSDAPRLMLRGTKIVGDVHVPAGRTSFLVDLAKAYPIAPQLAAGTPGLVVVFGPAGAQILELSQRAASVARWCKGRGQVNTRTDRWQPMWVDVDCLLYGSATGGGGVDCGYSIVWQDPAHGVRVMVDFARMPCDDVHTWASAAAAAAVPQIVPHLG